MSDSRVRLVYTEPNLYAAEAAGVKFGNGKIATNMTWRPEDLNISVDLQVVVPSRSDCGEVTQNLPVTFSNGLGVYTSFLSGSKVGDSNYLTADYTEASYNEIRSNSVSTTESLGISSIDIRFDAHFYPQVTMKFTDVRGYSLYMPAEEEYVNRLQDKAYKAGNATKPGRPYTNLFKAIFHFPYPKFLLTVKGFYGNKVTFILAVNDFKTALNGQNGNFDVTISFIGYMYGLYTDIPMSYIMIAPYMDSKDGLLTESSYWKQQSSRFISKAANSSGEGENATQPIPTFLELARNYAELDIPSEDTLGTETEEYYTIQSAYNSLNDIIKNYKDLVSDFYDGKIASGRTNVYDLYLMNDKQVFSWNKNDKANELYKKITEHQTKYGAVEISKYNVDIPVLLRPEDVEKNFSIDPSKLTIVELDDTRKKIQRSNGEAIFSDITFQEAVSDDSDFVNKLFSLLRNGEDKAQYTLVAFNGEDWISHTTEKLRGLGQLRDDKMKEAAKSAVKLYSEKLGYALTIENVFRMLFAHVECFFHYYLENTVYKIKMDLKTKNRTFKNLGIDYDRTDSDGIAVDKNSDVLPFPAIYDKYTNELKYPGEKMETVDMLEVDLVERLHEAAKMCGKEAAKVSELMALSRQEDISEETTHSTNSNTVNFPLPISFNGGFKPLTITDAFCECVNPYSRIPSTKNNTYNLISEIVYMAYLRYCIRKMARPDEFGNIVNNENNNKAFIAIEKTNITSAFSKLPKIEKDTLHNSINLSDNNFNAFIGNAIAGRIGKDFNIKKHGNTVLCTAFDTSEKNSENDISSIDQYMLNTLHGTYVLPDSVYDIFESMKGEYVGLSLTDFRTLPYIAVKGKLVSDTSYNKVYLLNEDPQAYSEKGKQVFYRLIYEGDGNENKKNGGADTDNYVQFYIASLSEKSYYDLIKSDRKTPEDYQGLYSPIVFYMEGSEYKNLLLSKLFWIDNTDIVSRAYLLLSSLISLGSNALLYNDDPCLDTFGFKAFRWRKLSVLYYGALIHRLRVMVNDRKDITLINDKNDKLGINKDIYNQKNGDYINNGKYYYYDKSIFKKDHRQFIEDAPLLALLSVKKPKVYTFFAENNKGGKLYSDIINVLKESSGPNAFDIGIIEARLKPLMDACDPSSYDADYGDSLEKYFLNWVETDFSRFIDILKEYVDITKDEVKEKQNKWSTIFIKDGKTLPCFQYSLDENSPNMFLNKLQCEEVCVLTCIPAEKTARSDDDTSEGFFNNFTNVLRDLFKELDEYYSEQTEETKEEVEQKVEEKRDADDSSLKKATYYTLKNLYDKWICGYGNFKQFLLPSPHEELKAKRVRYEKGDYYGDTDFKEMNNFLFVDAFYNDISDTFYCNPKLLYDLIMSCVSGEWKNCSIYQFMSKLAQDNKLLMKAFPVYNNFYNVNTINDIFTPHMSYDVANNAMAKRGFGSTYLLMYTNQPSKFLNEESKSEIIYRDDGFDLGDSLGHVAKLDTQFSITEGALNLPVPAFGVTYGMQNQQYFKGMNINMDNPITTDYSIANTLMLSQTGANGDKNFPMGVGQDIYAIYSNRSYTITVEMMGCVNIMPMMYFQLNNVPMFKGAYMIVSVSHSIKAGSMTTTFTGIRQSKFLYPTTNENMILTSIIDRINKDRSEQVASRGKPIYANVDGTEITKSIDGINIILDNALGEKYAWVPKSNGTPYPYKKRVSGPKHIILHYTAGTSSVSGSAGKLMSTWVNIWNNSEKGGGSADFGVDDGGIYQFTPDIDKWRASYCNGGDYKADGLGGRTQHDDAHLCGIGIEMCCMHKKGTSFKEGNHDGWSFTDKVLDNTAKLCAYIIKTHQQTMPCRSLEDVKRIISTHYRVSGKICPGIRGWNTGRMSDGSLNNENKLNDFIGKVWTELKK